MALKPVTTPQGTFLMEESLMGLPRDDIFDRNLQLNLNSVFGFGIMKPRDVVKIHIEPAAPKPKPFLSRIMPRRAWTTVYTLPVKYRSNVIEGDSYDPWAFGQVLPERKQMIFQWWAFIAAPPRSIANGRGYITSLKD